MGLKIGSAPAKLNSDGLQMLAVRDSGLVSADEIVRIFNEIKRAATEQSGCNLVFEGKINERLPVGKLATQIASSSPRTVTTHEVFNDEGNIKAAFQRASTLSLEFHDAKTTDSESSFFVKLSFTRQTPGIIFLEAQGKESSRACIVSLCKAFRWGTPNHYSIRDDFEPQAVNPLNFSIPRHEYAD